MVDFSKLRRQRETSVSIDPREIFLRLPKAPGFDDLWSSQADTLDAWFARREQQDTVIKMNTGGGKTLVGLLAAQSTMNEKQGPVLYLCPNTQLQGQVLEQARQYGIAAVPYVRGPGNLQDEFLGASAVMVGTYHALFHGRSKFGIAGSQGGSVSLASIIVDDAHTSFADIRDIFSLSVAYDDQKELYEELTTLFRPDFAAQGRQGTYDDVISGEEDVVFEVPYISWLNRSTEVRQRLSRENSPKYQYVWPLIRDHFEQCHAFVGKREFVITPLYPIMEMFPSFSNCPRRIFMSATVADDSEIIRTFGADPKSVSTPIAPTSLAGVGERMIVIPQLTKLLPLEVAGLAKQLARNVSKSAGVVILAPSRAAANEWSDVATFSQGDEVASAVRDLVSRSVNGPYVFPNRYDGIDLPGDSCRLLIVAGLPRGRNIYDSFRSTVLDGSATIDATLAQRIEQGMGRGTRGGGDHCVVMLLGNDLVSWVSLASNLNLMTITTREQVNIGTEISREIDSIPRFMETVRQCLERNPEWTQYHADGLADSAGKLGQGKANLAIAAEERKYFKLLVNGYPGKAASSLEKFVRDQETLDPRVKGWLLQLCARASHQVGNSTERERMQRGAHSLNRALQRPVSITEYAPLLSPTQQSVTIVQFVQKFELKKGVLAQYEKIVSNLVDTATYRQFEEALKDLGLILGFAAERPEQKDKGAPDVLWILDHESAWIMECKSRKEKVNALNKREHGQLLQSEEWFKAQYLNLSAERLSVHHNAFATAAVTPGKTKVLTLGRLGELVGSVRTLLEDLSSETLSEPLLLARCESRLDELHLRSSQIGSHFLVPLEVERRES